MDRSSGICATPWKTPRVSVIGPRVSIRRVAVNQHGRVEKLSTTREEYVRTFG